MLPLSFWPLMPPFRARLAVPGCFALRPAPWGLALAFSAAVASWIGGIVAVSFLSRVNALAEQMYGHHSTFEKGKFGTKSGP
jgi:hypothetical protein